MKRPLDFRYSFDIMFCMTRKVMVKWDSTTECGRASKTELPPRIVVVPIEIIAADLSAGVDESERKSVANWLSDEYGWCVEGWEVI